MIEFGDVGSVVRTVVLCVICGSFFCSWSFSGNPSVSSGKMACGFPIANAKYKQRINYPHQITQLCISNTPIYLHRKESCQNKQTIELTDASHDLPFRYMSDSVNSTLNKTVNPRRAPAAIQYHSLPVKTPAFSRTATPNGLPSAIY